MVTKPNKTGVATLTDDVQTPLPIARMVIDYFSPKGLTLEPCRGAGNIFNLLPHPKDWCEIKEGRDFFRYHNHSDWIITNPPYSIYDKFLYHCFEIADNIVLICPLVKAFRSMRTMRAITRYGGLNTILIIGSGNRCGFPVGFPVGCLYYKRGYKGDIKLVEDTKQYTLL